MKTDIIPPTPEQMARGSHEVDWIREGATTKGRAYRRKPWFETLARRDGNISDDHVRAMRFYRDNFETTRHSETRCALNRQIGGSRDDGPSDAIVVAQSNVAACEAGLTGYVLSTMRAIVLDDQTYAEVAMSRWGSRDLDIIDVRSDKVFIGTQPAPKSRTHVEWVKDEFRLGLRKLESCAAPLMSTSR